MNTLSWRTPTTPKPMEIKPRKLCERRFGQGGSAAERLARVKEDKSNLDAIPIDAFRRARVVDRIEHVKELHRFVADAQPCQRHDRPQRGVRVLTAVLAHSRNVALDVTGVVNHAIEGRRQQQDELRFAADQVHAHGVHGAGHTSPIACL